MILYKYYSESSGNAALESGCLGFRNPSYFNDPLELSYFSDIAESTNSAVDIQIREIHGSVAILSLTTSDENPLMWAHYGDEHRGFCIGYDVSCPFFSSDYCLITAAEGKVNYTDEKPISSPPSFSPGIYEVFLQTMGLEDSLTPHKAEIARMLYLTKSKVWEYEDEYRVVKLTDSFFEESHVFQSDPLRHFTIPSKPVSDDKPHHHRMIVPGLHIFSYKPRIVSVTIGLRNQLQSRNELFNYSIANKWQADLAQSIVKKIGTADFGWEFIANDLS